MFNDAKIRDITDEIPLSVIMSSDVWVVRTKEAHFGGLSAFYLKQSSTVASKGVFVYSYFARWGW